MRPSARYAIIEQDILPGRKRLLEAHKLLGSWERVAKGLNLNWRYVWDFAVNGKLPRNPVIRKKLIGRKTVNEHLEKDRISEMPKELLEWAITNRK